MNVAKISAHHRFKLMIVIPAFNEEGNICMVLSELSALSISGFDIEWVVVDDGSRDRTRSLAKAAGAQVISLPYNMGIGMTVQTGFKYAVSQGAEFVAQLDGDCQHIPGELSKILAPLQDGRADVVIGSRYRDSADEGVRSSTWLRWFVGRALAFNVWALTGMRITDTTSGFRVFNQRAAAFIAAEYPDDYPEVEILVSLAVHGFRVQEVPVKMRPRQAGVSSIHGLRAIYYVTKVMMSTLFHRLRR